jgi:hypothetical protein
MWWGAALLTLGGVIVGGLIGMATARIQARWANRGLRIIEQEKLLAATRNRRVELYDPLMKFIWTIEEVTNAPPALWDDDTPEKRTERHGAALAKQRATFSEVSARMWLESPGEAVSKELQELWVAFRRHMQSSATTPNPVYRLEDQRAAVTDITSQCRALVAKLKADIAEMDEQAQALVALEAARPPLFRLGG